MGKRIKWILPAVLLIMAMVGPVWAKGNPEQEMKRDLQAIRKALKQDKNAPKWLRIEVIDRKEDERVKVNLPIQMVLAFLEFAIDVSETSIEVAKKRGAKEDVEDMEKVMRSIGILKQFKPQQWIEWLKELPNGEIITVESKDEKVRIWVE